MRLSEEDLKELANYSNSHRYQAIASYDFVKPPRIRKLGETALESDYYVNSRGMVYIRGNRPRLITYDNYPCITLQEGI